MPEDEGASCTGSRASGSPHGPALEVGTYCGKSAIYLGAAAREVGGTVFTVDHHRGSEENQAGWEHHDASLVDPEFGLMDTLPVFRRTIARAGLEDQVVAVVGRSHDGRRALAHAAVAAVHRRRARRGARAERLHRLGALGDARAARWSIHDVFPRPGGRRPAAVPRLPARARERRLRPRSRRSARCGCYAARRRRRRPGRLTPSAELGQPHSRPISREVGASEVAAHDARTRPCVPGHERVGGEDHRGGGVRRVLDRPVSTLVGSIDVAGPVAAVRRRAGAACRRSSAQRAARGRRARRAPAPARRSRRRSPTGWCRRSGCRARAPRSRPSGVASRSRAGVAADRAAEHRVVPVHRERRLVQEQVAVLAQRVAEPAAGELPLRLRLVHQLGRARRRRAATGRCSSSRRAAPPR